MAYSSLTHSLLINIMQAFSWQRAVIKVGSSLIAPGGGNTGCSAQYLLAIAKFITGALAQGKEIIIVSAGSVAAGRSSMPLNHPPSIAEKQAMAAIGQTKMMQNWARFFDQPCAQVLLTMDDLHDRERYINIQNTFRELLRHHAIPIVNENDTVAINELKVGDNDNLAAYTALVAQADTCIICSDIDGLYDADPRVNSDAILIPLVTQITPEIEAMAGGAGSAVGTGGMETKIQAAQRCCASGIQTLIVNGTDADVFSHLGEGRCKGTLFAAQASQQTARAQWLTHTLNSRGQIHVDEGARNALVNKGASLLPSGLVKISQDFHTGDAVDVLYAGEVIGKGIALFSSKELYLIKGHHSDEIEATLGYVPASVVIHRDNLIIY